MTNSAATKTLAEMNASERKAVAQATALAYAKAQAAKARNAWDAAKTAKASREADEDLLFWTNKVAYLANAR